MAEKVHFRTNILLKNIIGKDLITDDNLAVSELVKNAYDAGTKVVEIRFEHVVTNNDTLVKEPNEDTSRILICDQGCGMDSKGIADKWLNIAYSEKKDNAMLNGRRQAGNKGVGRFSCDRLGKTLTILTKEEGKPCFKISIDWRLFEQNYELQREMQDIEFVVEEVSDEVVKKITKWTEFRHGTILDIKLLREKWTPDKIVRLRRDLEKFINPNSAFTADSFQINITAEEYEEYDSQQSSDTSKVNGIVRNRIFDNLDFRTTSISSKIDKEGLYIITSLQDRGREVFELKEKNIYPHLRDIKMTVYFLNSYSKRYFSIQTGIRSVDFGSIFLFINGFRIPPYGDQGDDWLGIERRKSSGYKRYLSTRDIVGRIEINESNDFVTVSSRAGVVNNMAFEELSREGVPYGFFYKGFRRLERFVVEGISWDKSKEKIPDYGQIKENYALDDFSRDKQILTVIRSIVDVDDSSISYLNVNEEFVREIMSNQMAETALTLEYVVKNFSELTDEATPEVIDALKERLENNQYELNKLVAAMSKLAPNNSHSKEFVQIQQDALQKQHELNELQQQLEQEQKARIQAQQDKEELLRKLELEKEKNTYLLTSSRSMSEDAKSMVHNIKIISGSLHSLASTTYRKIQGNRISKEETLAVMSRLMFQADKAMKISKLITRANFKAESENKNVDVVAYISQYLDIYGEIMEDTNIEIEKRLNDISFMKKISVLDIAIILDNMISNAQKAKAQTVRIEASLIEEKKLMLTISDDGEGLNSKFHNMENSIFELGVTTTDGSGIGLHTVKNVVEEMKGSVTYVGKGIDGRGACFNIIIP